jgi:hypothetical protein
VHRLEALCPRQGLLLLRAEPLHQLHEFHRGLLEHRHSPLDHHCLEELLPFPKRR